MSDSILQDWSKLTLIEKAERVVFAISGYVKKHELMLLIVLGLALTYWGYDKWVKHAEHVADLQAQVSAQVLAQNKVKDAEHDAQDAKNAQATAAVLAQYQQTLATLTAQQQASQAVIASLVGQLKKQQASNDQLDSTGMANRYAVLENLPLGNFTPNGPALLLSPAAAHQVLNDLEEQKVDQKTIAEKDKQLAAKDVQIKSQSDVVVAQAEQIGGLKATVTQRDNTIAACQEDTKKQVKKQKDDDRAARNRWLKAGVAIGSIAVLVVEHVLLKK